MKVIREGYEYQLKNLIKDQHDNTLTFVEKPYDIDSHIPGTTNEEVLDVLIHRMRFLNQQVPSRENSIVITKLQEAKMWLKERAMDRNIRGVKHTDKI
jgi:hypothetical protein